MSNGRNAPDPDMDRPVELTDTELDQVVGGTQPPGLLGYEGQPGNQGGPQHHP
jgi:bacteriocin-like protein